MRFTGCEAGKHKDFVDWQPTIKVSTHIETVIKYKPQLARKQPIEQKAKTAHQFWMAGKKNKDKLWRQTCKKLTKEESSQNKVSLVRFAKLPCKFTSPNMKVLFAQSLYWRLITMKTGIFPYQSITHWSQGSQIKLCKSAPWSNYFMFLFCFKY